MKAGSFMIHDLTMTLAIAVFAISVSAQEKPVPKDSVRVYINGCANGAVFTAGPIKEDQPGRSDIREGTKLRLQGDKKILNDIKAHKGSEIEVTGLIRKGQFEQGGIALGGHVRVGGAAPMSNDPTRRANFSQTVIDVEGWRQLAGSCPN